MYNDGANLKKRTSVSISSAPFPLTRLEYASRNLRVHVLLSLNDGVLFYHRSAEIETPCIEWTFRRNVSVHEVCN